MMKSLNNNLDSFEKQPEIMPDLLLLDKINKSFLLLDEKGNLQVSCTEKFLKKLNSPKNSKVKVVSIFGNTGEGKSYTMNHMFFKGAEVFQTSNEQVSCTLGVWAAYDPDLNVICLDTEGLQGITNCENERTKLLLKVLAISDIVIYEIRSERLNRDLFVFLSTASHAYSQHFKAALEAIGQQKDMSNAWGTLGPSVIVLHETRHTKPLTNNDSETAEDILKAKFKMMNLTIDAFSSIKYVGLQTMNNATDYTQVRAAIKMELDNNLVRSARKPYLVYKALKSLHKLRDEMENLSLGSFPQQYFTCLVKCLSCDAGCINSMGHLSEGKPHTSNASCKFQCQYENSVYICKKCQTNGNEVEVTKRYQESDQSTWYKFAPTIWSGYTINCPNCGEIYKSNQYWYGNDAEDVAVAQKSVHVWNTPNSSGASQNTAQRVIDSVTSISESFTNISLQPSKALKAWAADQVAPSYWRSNSEIQYCHECKYYFGITDDKHHCRDCGEGFCGQCSANTKCVPHRNWFTPVRVCNACYKKETPSSSLYEPVKDVNARKVTEHVVSTFNVVGNVFTYSKTLIKDTVRPSYWIPDSEIISCSICKLMFSHVIPLHHCRACGRGVCQECSPHRKPVPFRGWDHPVRVCNACV
ncbi:zinc finger FYVE domain-containing protein 1-like isoform X2 [Pseudomyrmex gracilis]|uniref:zinc finger FYVE domain-containing protein 1-like isoform X2 n=1 Tax=Pseudomyrmex gracilis TaxID=219809 RepID=UPI000995B91F|nr:zinc finger FYVE domain-containing protein 1-like isoform X2 [Pseudomyrmex gracilis]